MLDDPGPVQRLALVGKPDLWIHPIAAATRGLQGEQLAEMASCRAAGARAVGTGAGWIADTGVMARVLAYARDLDMTVDRPCRGFGGLTGDAVATAGETATRLGLSAAPAVAEALAVARDLMLAEETGARLHLRQVTAAAAFDLVRAAKRRGVRVTCGITPAHLLLSDIAVSDFRTFAHLSPPLRSEADRQACRAALADGTIDVLCSGHAPKGPEAKRLPFADSQPGMAGAATLLATALTLVRDGLVTLERLFALLAVNPAAVLGIDTGHARGRAAGGPAAVRRSGAVADRRHDAARRVGQHAVRRLARAGPCAQGLEGRPGGLATRPGRFSARRPGPSLAWPGSPPAARPARAHWATCSPAPMANEAVATARAVCPARPVGIDPREAADRQPVPACRTDLDRRALRRVTGKRGVAPAARGSSRPGQHPGLS